MKIPFGDLRRQYNANRERIDSAIQRVLDNGWFVLGREVEFFEQEFAAYTGAKHAVGVASGTDAIHLALRALGLEPGDEVITAANTCVPTASAISLAGAVPVVVDVDPVSYTIDPAKIEAAITPRTKAIVPVHLYGQAADMDRLCRVSRESGIPVVEDVAQGHGATYRDKRLGTMGQAGCFSFYPSKNLGAYGDGGAIVTDSRELADKLRQLRNYGEARRYYHATIGFNSRLDEIQAAILRAKLAELDSSNERRRQIAALYNREITNPRVRKPVELEYGRHNYHLYVVRCERRDQLQQHLAGLGVQTLIHYPVPIHLQEAYRWLGMKPGSCPAAEQCASEVLSLPIFPELSDEEAMHVAASVNSFIPRA